MIKKIKKRKSKKKILNLANIMIMACSILAGYSAVALSNSTQDLQFRPSKTDLLVSSADRIAIAFEQYNEKRFTP
jgi:hypothetical protein